MACSSRNAAVKVSSSTPAAWYTRRVIQCVSTRTARGRVVRGRPPGAGTCPVPAPRVDPGRCVDPGRRVVPGRPVDPAPRVVPVPTSVLAAVCCGVFTSLVKPDSIERGPPHRLGVEPVRPLLCAEDLWLFEERDHVSVLRQIGLHRLGGLDALLVVRFGGDG